MVWLVDNLPEAVHRHTVSCCCIVCFVSHTLHTPDPPCVNGPWDFRTMFCDMFSAGYLNQYMNKHYLNSTWVCMWSEHACLCRVPWRDVTRHGSMNASIRTSIHWLASVHSTTITQQHSTQWHITAHTSITCHHDPLEQHQVRHVGAKLLKCSASLSMRIRWAFQRTSPLYVQNPANPERTFLYIRSIYRKVAAGTDRGLLFYIWSALYSYKSTDKPGCRKLSY